MLKQLSLPLVISAIVPLAVLACDNPRSPEDPSETTDIDTDTDTDEIDPRYLALGEAFDDERALLGAPAAAMAIVEGGRVVYATGRGTLEPGGGAAANEQTLFRIGSVTKMLTATALLQLAEDAAVDLAQPCSAYLPTLAFSSNDDWLKGLTVSHLVTHTSGICDYLTITAPPGYETDDGLASFLLGRFGHVAYFMAPPGAMYNYSNPNYSLAGLLVEQLGGEGYRQAMHDRVFAPLGMNRTFFLPQQALADGNVATGLNTAYIDVEGLSEEILPGAYDNPWARPAGYAFSSVLDLARFVLFLRDGNPAVLGDTWREAMQSPQVSTKELADVIGYGYGLTVQQGFSLSAGYYDVRVVTHGGAIPGYSANVTYVPDLDLGLVTLASTDGAYFQDTLVQTLEALGELPPTSEPPDLTVDPATYPELAGLYVDYHVLGEVTVTATQDTLSVSIPALLDMGLEYTSELTPLAPDSFLLFIDDEPMVATFIRDESGAPVYLRTRVAVATRSDEASAKAVALDEVRSKRALAEALRQPLLPAPHPALTGATTKASR